MANFFTRAWAVTKALSYFYRATKRAQSLDLKKPLEWFKIFGESTSSGINVDKKGSIGIAAVYTSAKIIGETLGSLTFEVIQKKGNVREQVNHMIRYYGGHSPNPDRGVTAYNYWTAVGLHLATWGNSYSIIHRNGVSQKVKGWTLTYPGDWQILEDTNGVITYKHARLGVFTPDDILHYKVNSWEGVVGISPVSANRETMGLSMKQQQYAGKVYGEKPPGWLGTDGNVDKPNRDLLQEAWEAMTTGDNLGKTPVLTGGVKYHPIMLPPGDSEYIESRKLNKEEIYAIFRIPPTFAQDYENTPYNTSEHQDLILMKHAITPYVRNIEQEMELKLLPVSNRTAENPLQIRFNQDSLLRADFKTRTEGYRVLWNIGALSQNEIRQLENKNPVEGGDRHYVPMNMVPSDKVDELLDNPESRAAYIDLIKNLNGKERLHIEN